MAVYKTHTGKQMVYHAVQSFHLVWVGILVCNEISTYSTFHCENHLLMVLTIFDQGRLVQLLIGCAVNCDEKQQYIEGIMSMEASLRELIMQAIQELLDNQVN